MLELTRRMTPERTCFSRIAGAYMDAEGYEDGTFNIHFLKLSGSDKKKNLELAKTIPFSKSNEELKEYADSFDWDETKGYNLIDWEKDDLDVVREKLKARIKQDD